MSIKSVHIIIFHIFLLYVLLSMLFFTHSRLLAIKEYENMEAVSRSIEKNEVNIPQFYTLGGMKYPILSECPKDFSPNTLSTTTNAHCLVSEVPLAQKYGGLQILGIDATFNKDGIDLRDAGKYFSSEGATFYSTQSPGVIPNRGVLRINSDYLFGDQKIFYIFYNDTKKISNFQLNQLVKDLSRFFPFLDDIRLHTFSDYKRDISGRPQDSDIGKLFYYVGDCQYNIHGACSGKRPTSNRYEYFSDAMIDESIDAFFLVPTTMVKTKVLDGMYKSTLGE